MIHFECLGCEIDFFAEEIEAVCPSCGESADVWIWDSEFYEPELDDSEVFASIGWGTDEDYGYYGE